MRETFYRIASTCSRVVQKMGKKSFLRKRLNIFGIFYGACVVSGATFATTANPSATRRYTKVHFGFCVRFSTLIGQIGRVPLFGAGPRRYIRSRLFRLAVAAFWRAVTASWRQKGKRKQRSFLGPLARQNCLQTLRP